MLAGEELVARDKRPSVLTPAARKPSERTLSFINENSCASGRTYRLMSSKLRVLGVERINLCDCRNASASPYLTRLGIAATVSFRLSSTAAARVHAPLRF
jgi:hypothetical protein